MDINNLQILGLDENATREDMKNAYDVLRAKYLEERFMDGEAGNEAARMLTKIETAYQELTKEFYERPTSTDGGENGDGGDAYEQVEQLINDEKYQEAQRLLDNFNERGAHWHFLQSKLFYRKNWINESKKQLEIAIRLDPDNQRYKEAYRKINSRTGEDASDSSARDGYRESVYRGGTMDSVGYDDQMGGSACARCLECYCYSICFEILCNGCCQG